MSAVLAAEADSLEWVPLKSASGKRNVQFAAYNPDFARLFVKFKSGERYAYEKVPRAIFDAFCVTPSAGQFLYYTIRAKGTDSLYAYAGPF